jgi:hypothetical protein
MPRRGVSAAAVRTSGYVMTDDMTFTGVFDELLGRQPVTLDTVHAAFTRWLGDDYDTTVLDVVLAVAACEHLAGDPPWLLVVSGAGAAKTETVQALAGAGAHITSTISSEGALLSATAKRERTKDATGGLLRKIGDRGLVVVKDVTSILSMAREVRSGVLAALREVYDGRWERNVGTDGGHTLTWTGRLVVVGAVTTAWDSAHAVVAAMGDRFVLVRLDSGTGRARAGRQAVGNSGDETEMRGWLAEGVGTLLATVTDQEDKLTDGETDLIVALADVVTLTRTAVERDYRGDVIDAHAPEMPTRFAKQLAMIVKGALALGMDRARALALAVRCARDSMPPLRLAVLADVHTHPATTTHACRVRLDKPRTTVDQTLQCLHALGLLTVAEDVEHNRTVWRYSLSDAVNRGALALMIDAHRAEQLVRETSLHVHSRTEEGCVVTDAPRTSQTTTTAASPVQSLRDAGLISDETARAASRHREEG